MVRAPANCVVCLLQPVQRASGLAIWIQLPEIAHTEVGLGPRKLRPCFRPPQTSSLEEALMVISTLAPTEGSRSGKETSGFLGQWLLKPHHDPANRGVARGIRAVAA